MSIIGRPCLLSHIGFCFVGLPFFPPDSWPLSFLSLFPSFSSSSYLPWVGLESPTPDRCRAFVHGHTFLHAWSWPMTLVVELLHGATFLSNLTAVLFMFLNQMFLNQLNQMPDMVIMHGHTLLHSWSGPITLVVDLLHGTTFLSNLPLVLFVSFIWP